MLQIVIAVFSVLHGLVHLLYLGQSVRLFQLQPGMVWPDGSWAFSRLLSNEVVRALAGVSCAVAAIGFVAGGIAVFSTQVWWRPVVAGSAAFSVLIFVLFWDGLAPGMPNKGLFAILINLAILVGLLVFRWPRFGF